MNAMDGLILDCTVLDIPWSDVIRIIRREGFIRLRQTRTFEVDIEICHSKDFSFASYLDNIISSASWSSGITVSGGNGSFFQQPHKLSHRVGHHNLRISLHEDIQFWIFTGLWFLASGVEAAFCCDRGSCRFQDFGDISSIGDSPTSFFFSTG